MATSGRVGCLWLHQDEIAGSTARSEMSASQHMMSRIDDASNGV